MNIIIHSDDIELSNHWEKALKEVTLLDSIADLSNVENSIIILNVSSCTPNCIELIKELKINKNRVLVLQRVPNLTTAKEFLRSGADGYGNALLRTHFLSYAIFTIENGMIWLHPELTSEMIIELPSSSKNENEILTTLTKREKEVALLLKDALTYKEVSYKLDITVRTVKAHASKIYTKLNVKDRLALAILLK